MFTKVLLAGCFLLAISPVFLVPAYAATRMGKATSSDYFKIDGKGKHSAQEADDAAKDHEIQRCKEIKNSEPPAFKCDVVVKEYSARTGNPTWKRP